MMATEHTGALTPELRLWKDWARRGLHGKILRGYTKSHFLDHVMRDTGGHIQEVLHYKLVCLNHLIDVVSYYPPDVEVLAGGETLSTRKWVQ